ncbi:hypothetical protein CWE09_00010 [Aliidiomarina minuta]|uniref:DUF6268 domain-containing protein n=1 Tax=Aliidiomarina minuta TaxID=880057 RepID=A0A432W5B5_9GAMM|nr:DUF6268 family outer membrane beta-barrel protein [Aliidiomarina minuta]RUO25169.1 hypothetical protein CWE09_00010 [Aliidiomarina minuta]
MRISATFISSLFLLAIASAHSSDEELSTDFHMRYLSTESSRLSGQENSFSLNEYQIEIERHAFLFEVDHRDYNWRQREVISGDPDWGSLTRIAPGLQYFGEVTDNWSVWAKLYAIAGFENSITKDSLTYNPQLIALTPYNDDIMLFAGVGAFYHPVDPVYYPILGLNWDAGNESRWSGALGFPETMIRYQLNDDWSLKAEFEVEIRFYQLSNSNQFSPGGYVKTDDLLPGLQLEFAPTSSFSSYLGLQYSFERTLSVYNSQRDLQERNQVTSGWGIRFGLEWVIN